ncbi:TPA: hypothetical protein L4559_003453 [Pseudomonas aeruginosa]|nr:hypothetical protein [Pseudomonas aeruginosa]
MSNLTNQELLERIQATEQKAKKAVPGAEWFRPQDLSQASNIDLSAAKLVSELDPAFVIELCRLATLGLAVEPVMSRLHGDIMNIPCDESNANEEFSDRRSAYQHAHRDARHAAAELTAAAFFEHLETTSR